MTVNEFRAQLSLNTLTHKQLVYMAADDNTSKEIIKILINLNDTDINCELSFNHNLSKDVIDALKADADADVRWCITQREERKEE